MKIKPKTQVLEAWQYMQAEMPEWVIRNTRFVCGELFLIRRSGNQLIKSGEWLAIDEDNDIIHLTNAEVKYKFDVLEE